MERAELKHGILAGYPLWDAVEISMAAQIQPLLTQSCVEFVRRTPNAPRIPYVFQLEAGKAELSDLKMRRR